MIRYGSGMAQRALGRVSRAAGDPEGAARWLEAALESFQSIQAPFEVGRTRLELAVVSGAGSEEAARQLGEARRIFTEIRLPGYMEKAERLARELAVAPSLERSGGPNVR